MMQRNTFFPRDPQHDAARFSSRSSSSSSSPTSLRRQAPTHSELVALFGGDDAKQVDATPVIVKRKRRIDISGCLPESATPPFQQLTPEPEHASRVFVVLPVGEATPQGAIAGRKMGAIGETPGDQRPVIKPQALLRRRMSELERPSRVVITRPTYPKPAEQSEPTLRALEAQLESLTTLLDQLADAPRFEDFDLTVVARHAEFDKALQVLRDAIRGRQVRSD